MPKVETLFVEGDTAPALSDRVGFDLTGATVVLRMKRPDKTILLRTATITDAAGGAWSYTWQEGELVNGSWSVDVEVTFSDGSLQTSPTVQPLVFIVRGRLSGSSGSVTPVPQISLNLSDLAGFPAAMADEVADPASPVAAALSSTYGAAEAQGLLLGGAAVLAHRIASGFDPIIVQNLGDSTSYGEETGIQQGWNWLASQLPTYRATKRRWSDALQCYEPWTTIQEGSGERYSTHPGTAGNYIYTADSAALRITGDLDVSCKVALTDWTPAGESVCMAKWAAAGQRGWHFGVAAGGALYLNWSNDGTTVNSKLSTALPAVADGGDLWIRATLDVDNGSSGSTVTFYTGGSGADPAWVQLGAPVVTAGTTSIYATTAIPECGSRGVGTTSSMAGKFYRGIVRNGIGGPVVASPSLLEYPYVPGGAVWKDGEGNVWSMTATAPSPTVNLCLSIYNGGLPGGNITHFNGAAFAKFIGIGETALTVIDLGHNDIASTATYQATYEAFIQQILSAQPNTPIACFTQNPKLAPATGLSQHNRRNQVIAMNAAAKRYGLIDVYAAFAATGAVGSYMVADGIHPNAAGYTLWLETFKRWLLAALHRTA